MRRSDDPNFLNDLNPQLDGAGSYFWRFAETAGPQLQGLGAKPGTKSGFLSTTSSTTTSTTTTTTTTATTTTVSLSAATNGVYADMLAHEVNGVLTYAGALTVLKDAAATPMSAALFSNLTAAAQGLNASGGVATSAYVQQIFDDVVLGNSANAYWNGGSNTAVALGNLTATSSQTKFNELIGKWFLGTDMPGVAPAPGQTGNATTYKSYSLPLFTTAGPQLTDVNQGQLGDCWFLAALGETAKLHPSLIQHLITDNGNGTYSVEFQVNGHADYVTVNNQLSTYSSLRQYDGSYMEFANSTTSLWVPLMEKALAQLSEQSGVRTGMQYAGGQDQYYELNSGLGQGISLLTGQNYGTYGLAGQSGASLTSLLGQMHNDLAAGYDVMLGTSGLAATGNLVASHMFAVTSVDSATGMVGLYNPWGANASGAGKAASFTIAASTLVADQANFFAANSAINVA